MQFEAEADDECRWPRKGDWGMRGERIVSVVLVCGPTRNADVGGDGVDWRPLIKSELTSEA